MLLRPLVALVLLGAAVHAAPQTLVAAEGKLSDLAGGFEGSLSDGDGFGDAVACPGDLDGNGVPDLAVGAYLTDAGGPDRGALWILFLEPDGSVSAQREISSTSAGPAPVLSNGDYFGSAVAALGDLDGDGVGDLAVGARRDAGGALWILFLNADGSVKALQKIAQDTGGFGGTLEPTGAFGSSLSALGDLNGDGVVDLAVGDYLNNEGGEGRGAVWILFLNADGSVDAEQKIGFGQGGFGGELEDHDWFGRSVAGLGDLDGDGLLDLAVGESLDGEGGSYVDGDASRIGAVWILFLEQDGTVRDQQKINPSQGGFSGTLSENDEFGVSLAPIGDADGDGVADLAVGAWRDSTGRGAVWLLFLFPDGTVKSHGKIGEGHGGLTAELDGGDRFGVNVASLGDVDGDAIGDLAVGAFGDDDGGLDRGAVHILFLGCLPIAATRSENPGGTNPESFSVSGVAALGGTLYVGVDTSGTTGHTQTAFFGFRTAADVLLAGGQRLLVDVAHPEGDLLAGLGGPVLGDTQTEIVIPADASLCGATIHAQALHFGGVAPFALSNRVVITLGI